ncbi:aldehyde reductase [Colletotrichum sojae]|uniref:Aldehyde reductase n=1 Tax=Colletotrichum sojae TaxID=2175907 RepID=A0A8H6MVE5_9PEZI|nr:aldehyde reductase [Colletotrichum sojae]
MEIDMGQISAESPLKELHAYAKLLFLRSGRQFEDKTSYSEFDSEVSPDGFRNDGDSSKNVPLGNLDVDGLRREFLDRLSETVSSTKGGRHIVASHMFYWPDKAKVFVAINSGVAEGDAISKFLGNLCAALTDIAAASGNQTENHEDALWNMLLRHQSSRLNAVIVELRQIMKNFQHLLPEHSSSEPTIDDVFQDIDGAGLDFEDCLKLLAMFLFGNSDSDLEKHHNLVSLSHALYRTFPAKHFHALGRTGHKLHQAIGFLGRLRTSFRVLVAAARHVNGFDNLLLIPVLSDTTAPKVMKPSSSKVRWTQKKLLNDFSRLKSPTWEVHAEIQLIIYILGHPGEVANGQRFDYIGCSSWTVPLRDNLGKGEQDMLSGAVMKVISEMRKELISSKTPLGKRRLEIKESTIGGSFVVAAGARQQNRPQSHAALEHLRRQRAQNSPTHSMNESILDSIEYDNHEASRIQTRHDTLAESTAEYCTGYCGTETTRRCSHCGGAPFCGKTCERKMPLSHLLKCNMRQVTSADYLNADVLVNELPTDPQVQQDYLFDRCRNKFEESQLFGVFLGLLKYHPNHVNREELHQWRSNPGGNPYLVAKIVEKFEELPSNSRGGYFPWFLGHRDIEDLSPFAKMHCFVFYSMAVDHLYPPPLNSEHCHWFDFGFVVTHDEHEERTLGSMYVTMLFGPPSREEYAHGIGSSTTVERINKNGLSCSFEEFWNAWERGKLMSMFNKCWPDLPADNTSIQHTLLRPEYDLLPHLREFLEAETPRPSIWRLRHFLAIEESVESAVSGIAQAARDYGFSEKLNARTTMELRDFYVQLLKKVEPLHVQVRTALSQSSSSQLPAVLTSERTVMPESCCHRRLCHSTRAIESSEAGRPDGRASQALGAAQSQKSRDLPNCRRRGDSIRSDESGREKELFHLLREHNMAFYAYSTAAGGLFSRHKASSGRWKSDNFIGKVYTHLYRKPPVRLAVSTILKLAEKHGINGHAAALRWTAFHGSLEAARRDAVIFGVSKIEQLHQTLDTLEAGPIPEDLAAAITAVYSKVEGAEPPYHL